PISSHAPFVRWDGGQLSVRVRQTLRQAFLSDLAAAREHRRHGKQNPPCGEARRLIASVALTGLAIIQNRLRCGFAQFNPCAHWSDEPPGIVAFISVPSSFAAAPTLTRAMIPCEIREASR